jgi:Gpi16 subunit, GPI transamidase component
MTQRHDRWERIVIAIDDVDKVTHTNTKVREQHHHHHSNEHRNMLQPHEYNSNKNSNENTITVRLESSTISRGVTPASSLFISPHAIELLSTTTLSTTVLGGGTSIVDEEDRHQTSSTLKVKDTSRPIKSNVQQQRLKLQVTKVHIQVANQPSQTYPETMPPLVSSLYDDDGDIVTGPSGIMVQVDYEVISTTTTTKPIQHHLHRTAKQHFMYTVLPFLSGQRRIMIAPFHTIDNIKLHRYVHCRSSRRSSIIQPTNAAAVTITNIQCTTILPHEGAHAAFSTEGFRAFLQQRPPTNVRSSTSSANRHSKDTGGIWSQNQVASPKEWSHFFIGSGYPIPQSLTEASQSFSAAAAVSSNINPTDGNIVAPFTERRLINRRMYWIHWERHTERYNNGTEGVVFEAKYGLQYSLQIRGNDRQQLHKRGVSLNDLLPHSSTNQDKNYQSDPFADRSTIEVITSSNFQNTLEWNPDGGCQSSTTSTTTTIGKAITCTITPFKNISRAEPLFLIESDESKTSSHTASDPIATTLFHYWKVQTHLYRPHPGQAYRGTYSGMIQNQLIGCDGINVNVHQSIPAILDPIWQSLHVRIRRTTMTPSPNNAGNQVPLPSESVILPWHELDDYHVDFQSDGSFTFEMQHIVPSQSILEIIFDYEPKYMNVDFFPADPNRGFEIPPMIVQIMNLELDGTDMCHEVLQQTYRDSIPIVTLYSNALLLLAPLPDMSMPFNVLSFTCTFYVFVIGSLMNLLLKKVSAQMKAKILDTPKESKILMLKRNIRNKLQRLFSKASSS